MGRDFDLKSYVYEKQFRCPVCESEFLAPAARHVKFKTLPSDSDLKQNYEPFDPILYDAVVCPECGYAESPSSFTKVLPEKTVANLLSAIKPKYGGLSFPVEVNADIALKKFALTLISNEAKKGKIGSRAHTYLKMAWVCREAEDAERERKYLEHALLDFKRAFEKEKVPIAGMDENAVSYLIGELERRVGSEGEALKWFGRVLASRGCQQRIKERALDQKALILDQRKSVEENVQAVPEEDAEQKHDKHKRFKWF